MSERFVTASEAARRLGISEKTVRNRIAAGLLRAEKQGRVWRILLDEDAPSSERSEPESERSSEPPEGSEPHSEYGSDVDTLRMERDALTTEVAMLRTKLEGSEQQSELLRTQLDHGAAPIDRLTMIIANEQAVRMSALPSPISWIKRIMQIRI